MHGTILAKDGKKLAKSSKNYTDPMELMRQYGTDAFRLYLYQSNAMLINDLLFDESGIQKAYQQIILPYWNACSFYISYANIDEFKPEHGVLKQPVSENQLDKWILAELYETEKHISFHMDNYQVNKYVLYLTEFLDGLTNWYIRRSRRRFWSSGMSEDKRCAYETLYYVLVNLTKLFAPAAPILSEKIYQVLTDEYSVHLTEWPDICEEYENKELIKQVSLIQQIIYLARTIRNKNQIKNRQPLRCLKIALSDDTQSSMVSEFSGIIAEELNVKTVEIIKETKQIADIKYAPDFDEIRSRYPERISEIIKAIKQEQFILKQNEVILTINNIQESFAPEIILVTYQAKNGQHVASGQGIVVCLDLTLTEELKREGIAREIVRKIQDTRKQLKCEITDRILLEFDSEIEQKWTEYICQETMGNMEKIDRADVVLLAEDEKHHQIEIKVKKTVSKF